MFTQPESEHVAVSGGERHRRSRRWLFAALAATMAGTAVMLWVVFRLFTPAESIRTAPLQSDTASSLTIAVARTPGGPGEWTNYARVIDYLSDSLGRPASVRYITEEDQTVELFKREKPNLAFVCSHNYVSLRSSGLARAVALPIIRGGSTTTLRLVVRSDSGIGDLAGLAGKRVAVSTKTSLGGSSYLYWLCDRRGLDALTYFGELRMGDTQEQNLRDLLAGEVDATVVNRVQVDAKDEEGLTTIEESPAFGNPPVVVSSSLDTATAEAIREALLRFDAASLLPEGNSLEGFAPVGEDDFDFSEEMKDSCAAHEHPDQP